MTALTDLTFLSVDVETSTKVAGTGHLLSVGIVPVVFRDGRWVALDALDCLYHRIEHPIEIDFRHPPNVDSVGWWSEQDPVVIKEAFDWSLSRYPRRLSAQLIHEFVRSLNDDWTQVIFAANPVSFDKPWVDQMIAKAGLELPWHYRSLCLRSMKFGMNISAGFGSDRTTHESSLPHHALYDALAQAQDLCDMLNSQLEAAF